MKSRLVASFAMLAFSIAGALPASSQHDLLGIDYTSARLWDVDPATGACSNPRAVNASFLVGLAASPDGTLYGLTTLASVPANALVTIDPVTGNATSVGTTGLTAVYEGGLAFDPTTGILYGIQEFTGWGCWMFKFDLTTGGVYLLGQVGGSVLDLSAMAFNSAGVCHILDTSADKLHHVVESNGNIFYTVPLSIPLGEVVGMAFDPVDDTLYVVDGFNGGTRDLYTCDPYTGVLTLVGPTGSPDGFSGLTFLCAVAASATFRNDAGGTNPAGYLASAPVLGAIWTASVDNAGMNNTLAGVVGFLTPLEYYLPGPDDWLLVNIVDPNGELLGFGTRAGSGVVSFSVPIPGDPALCGFAASTQGFGLGGTGGINLHNAYDVVLGTD